MASERIEYLDLAKGVGMCIVMLFHIKGILQYEFVFDNILFRACMLPPFFFLSGVFFKEGAPWRKFLIDKTNKLLIPFAFFYLITAVLIPNILHFTIGMNFSTVTGWKSLWAFIWPGEYPNIPLWFLWCLFLINLLFFAIYNVSKRWFKKSFNIVLALTCACCGLAGIIAEHLAGVDVACIFKVLQNLPFFCLGFFLKGFIQRPKMNTIPIGKKMVILLTAFIVTLITYIPIFNNSLIAYIFTFFLSGVAGIALIMTLSSMINYVPLISYIGRFSIIVLLTHGLTVRAGTPFVIKLSNTVGEPCAISIFWILMVLSYIILIPVLRFCLPHFTAQKNLLSS